MRSDRCLFRHFIHSPFTFDMVLLQRMRVDSITWSSTHVPCFTGGDMTFPSHHSGILHDTWSSASKRILLPSVFISRLKTYQELLTTCLLAYFVHVSCSLFFPLCLSFSVVLFFQFVLVVDPIPLTETTLKGNEIDFDRFICCLQYSISSHQAFAGSCCQDRGFW